MKKAKKKEFSVAGCRLPGVGWGKESRRTGEKENGEWRRENGEGRKAAFSAWNFPYTLR